MALTLEHAEGQSVVHLTELVNVGCAVELHRLLLEALAASQPVGIAFDPGTELDISALQLLCAAGKAARRQGVELAVMGGLPEAIERVIRESGLNPFSSDRPGENV
jgi:anti-anti-sigma regulatory factor